MGDSVWRPLQSKWCKSGLSSTRVLNLHSIRDSWNARVSVYKLITLSTLVKLPFMTRHRIIHLMMIYELLYCCMCSFNQILSDSPTWLDELRCLGTESKLIDCPANTIGVEDCTHTQDVGLVCSSPVTGKSCLSICYKYSIGWEIIIYIAYIISYSAKTFLMVISRVYTLEIYPLYGLMVAYW